MTKIKNKMSRTRDFKQKLFSMKSEARWLISNLKSDYQISEIVSIVQELSRVKIFDKHLIGTPFPKDYKNIMQSQRLYFSDSLEKELAWQVIVLQKYSSEINKFVLLRDQFENYLLLEDYTNAWKIIDQIENEICVSIWSIENRLILAELEGGIEKNKAILGQINNSDNDIIVSIISDFISRRVERDSSVNMYSQLFKKFLESKVDSLGAQEYLSYKLNFFGSPFKGRYAGILYYESNSSIIDRYLTLVKVSQLVSTDKSITTTEKNVVYQNILKLSVHIRDLQIDNTLMFLSPERTIKKTTASDILIEITDLYTQGQYEVLVEIIPLFLNDYPTCIELYEYYVKSLVYLNKNYTPVNCSGLIDSIILHLYNIYSRNNLTRNSLHEILKIVRIFGNKSFAIQLRCLVYDMFSNERDRYFGIAELNSLFPNPKLSRSLSVEHALKFLDNLKQLYNKSHTINFLSNYHNILDKGFNSDISLNQFLPEDREKRYLAQAYSYHGQHTNAVETLINLINKKDDICFPQHTYEQIVIELSNCYLQLGEKEKCLELVVNSSIPNEFFQLRFKLQDLINLIKKTDSTNLYSNICLPILYHMSNPKAIILIYAAYDNFLNEYGITKPSQLIGIAEKFDHNKIIYFFKNICTQEVMDHSYYFNSTTDLEDERILVLQYLIEYDTDNTNEYSNEISIITQISMMRKRIQQIDESKIFVDEKGIRTTNDKLLKESYTKYCELTDLVEYKVIDYTKIETKIETKIDYILIKPNFTSNVKYIHFKQLFFDIRDYFISSDEYGLDSYLSVRIRHGTLLGQLRRQFEFYNLITSKKDKTSTEYFDNNHWTDVLLFTNPEQKQKINSILNNFSLSIDKNIDKVIDWIQIKTESKNSVGLFDFTFTESYLYSHYLQVLKIEDFEEFIDVIFACLWIRTKQILSNINKRIIDEVKEEFVNELNSLEDHISKLNMIEDRSLKHNITNCRTNIPYELDKISKWFSVKETKDNIDFSASQLIDVCCAIVKNVYPKYLNNSFNINIESISIFKGWTFTYLVDMFLLILNNAIKHSSIDPESLLLSIKIEEDQENIIINVNNNFNESKRAIVETEVTKIVERIGNFDYVKAYARKEGGSGFSKIIKILQIDLRTKYSIDCYIDDDNFFYVTLHISKGGIITNENISG